MNRQYSSNRSRCLGLFGLLHTIIKVNSKVRGESATVKNATSLLARGLAITGYSTDAVTVQNKPAARKQQRGNHQRISFSPLF